MKTKTYSEKLKSPQWQKKRLEIMKRDKFKCKLCGDDETELHVHHKKYINGNDPWDYPNTLLILLCEHCHSEIEYLKKEQEIDYNKIKIYKSNDWSGGSRIMFIYLNDTCYMRIYGDNDEYLIGYGLRGETLHKIINILKKAL